MAGNVIGSGSGRELTLTPNGNNGSAAVPYLDTSAYPNYGPPQDTKAHRANQNGPYADAPGPGLLDSTSGFAGGYNQLADMFNTGDYYGSGNGALQAIDRVAPTNNGTVDTANALDWTRLGTTVADPFRAPARTPAPTHSIDYGRGEQDYSGVAGLFGSLFSGMPVDSNVPSNLDTYDPGMIADIKTKYPPAAPAPAAVSPVAQMYAPPAPITYTPAPFNYVAPQGSPNQSFEKQNGAGSLTQSMKDSSRWNTGY